MSTPSPEAELAFAKEKAKRTFPVTVLVLLGIIAMYLPLPRRFVAVVPLVLAVALTVRLLRFLGHRTSREKIWPAITLGLVGLLLSTLAAQAMFYPSVAAYEQCVAGAQTQQARADCEQLRETGPFGGGLLLP